MYISNNTEQFRTNNWQKKRMAYLANFNKSPNIIHKTSYNSAAIINILTFLPNCIFAKLFSCQTFVLYSIKVCCKAFESILKFCQNFHFQFLKLLVSVIKEYSPFSSYVHLLLITYFIGNINISTSFY